MANVRRIASMGDIPRDERYVAVTTGDANGLDRDGESYIVTTDRSLPAHEFESHLQVAISDAELLAERERIETVYVCIDTPRQA
jgi:hypothetical protein